MQEPVSAARDALIARLAERLPGVTVRRGFGATDAELQAGPVVSVQVLRPRRQRCAPEPLSTEDGETMYRVGWLTVPVQVDLWCAYEAQRDDHGNDLWEALTGSALEADDVETSAYHDRPVQIAAEGDGFTDVEWGDDGESTSRGEYRLTWTVRLTTDLVEVAEHPAHLETLIAIETELGEDFVEDTYDISDLPEEP